MRSWHQSCLTRVKKRLGERKGLERGRRKRWRRGRKDLTVENLRPGTNMSQLE